MFRRTIALLALLLAVTVPAGAELPDGIENDLKPLSGYVIMPVGGEYLIDQDAAKGVIEGDLFSVVVPGEKIIHPVTKEVLGSLDEVRGVLQVTRVKSGYAYASPLGPVEGVERGDVIRRFENVPATFWDYTGGGEGLFAELREALPGLDWQDYAAAQNDRPAPPSAPGPEGPALVFVLEAGGLTVRDAEFKILHAYPANAMSATISAAPSPPVTPVSDTEIEARLQALEARQAGLAANRQPSAPFRLEVESAVPAKGIRYGATFPGFKVLGNLTGVVTMGDFLQDGERLLLASTDGREIALYAVGDELTLLAKEPLGSAKEILGVNWWCPQGASTPHLAVTGWSGTRLESAILSLEGGILRPLIENLPYALGTFDLDGDGLEELLLGQRYDRDLFFAPKVDRLILKGRELDVERVDFDLPRDFTVQGSLFADVTADGRPEVLFVRHGMLYIYSGKKQLYRSPAQMGGSLSVATYETNPNSEYSLEEHAPFEVAPIVLDLDGDGGLEIVSVASERSLVSTAGADPGVKKSWLAVVKFRNGMFVKGTLGEELQVPLQGLSVDSDQALFVASEPASLLGQGGGSHLLALPLAQ